MADEQEIIMNKLVSIMSVDRQSIQQTVQDIRQGKEEETRVVNDAEAAMNLSLALSADIRRKQHLDMLSSLETYTKEYYQRELANHADNQEQIKQLQQNFSRDMETIRKRQEALSTFGGDPGPQELPGVKKDPMGYDSALKNLHRLYNDAMPIINALGMRSMAVGLGIGASIAFVADNMNQAATRLREMDTLGRGQAFATGSFQSGFAPGMAGSLATLRDDVQGARTPDQIARLAAQFTPIMETAGTAGATQMGKLTQEAMGLGAVFGVNEDIVAKTMVLFRRLEEVPVDRLGQAFMELGNRAFQAGFPVAAYAQLVGELSENTKRYGIGMDSNMRMIDLFARELQTGIITLGDIQRLQVGAASSSSGNRAFAIRQAIEKGYLSGDLGDQFRSLGGNAAAESFMAQRILQGGGAPGQREEITKAFAMVASDMSLDFAYKGGGTPAAREQMRLMAEQEFLRNFGILGDTTIEGGIMIRDAAMVIKDASEGFGKYNDYWRSLDVAVGVGLDSIRKTVSPQDVAGHALKKAFETGLERLLVPEKTIRERRRGELSATINSYMATDEEKEKAAKELELLDSGDRSGGLGTYSWMGAVGGMIGASGLGRGEPADTSGSGNVKFTIEHAPDLLIRRQPTAGNGTPMSEETKRTPAARGGY